MLMPAATKAGAGSLDHFSSLQVVRGRPKWSQATVPERLCRCHFLITCRVRPMFSKVQ